MPNEADPFPIIETPRLRLRCARTTDATRVAELMTPAISRWLSSWPIPYTAAMAVERIAAWGTLARNGRGMPCVVEGRSESTVIGWAHVLGYKDDPQRATMGYWLGEAYQGRGYMREAAVALVPAAFGCMGIDLIEAGAQPENVGSLAVMQALGMTLVGERMVFAPARGHEELCSYYELARAR